MQNIETHTPQTARQLVGAALHTLEKPSLPGLKKQLAHGMMDLKVRYMSLLAESVVGGAEQWLVENYYTLEREYKQTAKDLAALGAPVDGERLARLAEVLIHSFGTYHLPLEDTFVEAALVEIGEEGPLTVDELDFLPVAIRSMLLTCAFNAFVPSILEEREGEISYGVIGLTQMYSIDYTGIVERVSSVERILRLDPTGDYERMTRETRQQYRTLVSRIAKFSHRGEEAVAKEALTAAETAKSAGESESRCHVGYALYHSPLLLKKRAGRGRGLLLATVFLPTLLALALGLLTRSWWVALLSWLPLWEAVKPFLEGFFLRGVRPAALPQMDLEKVGEVPLSGAVISLLVPKPESLPRWEERLEGLYYANRTPNLRFCLLADLGEAAYPVSPEDEPHIRALTQMVEGLNTRCENRFLLFVRPRSYSRTQDRYSGYERKRGAILQFIRYIHGEQVDYHTVVGEAQVVHKMRYCIALDSDTNLLFDSAERMVSAAIHPLCRPVIDREKGRVTDGYGILVPRIVTELDSARATPFSRVMEGSGGVSGYDTQPRDVYQDLFGETIFTGKGLIDVGAFYTLLTHHLPENQILSHDILEGAYLRVGYLPDVELTDSAPTTPTSWLLRLHRWLRGDWQNILFLKKHFQLDGVDYENPISTLARYQLFENLRRAVTPPAILLALLGAWILPRPLSPVLGMVAFLSMALPAIWGAVGQIVKGGIFVLTRKYFTDTLPRTFELLGQAFFRLILLPEQAILSVDAAIKSIYRTFVSRKQLLEWQTFAQTEDHGRSWRGAIYRYGWAQLLGLLVLFFGPHWYLRLFGLCFSLLIPFVLLTSRRSPQPVPRLTPPQKAQLISYNAAMWSYYEEYVNAENHFLPPDNVQHAPVQLVAHRTSPTNIGCYLLSALAARDMGFLTSHGLYVRLDQSLETVEKLEKFRGNLYNWYDTKTLARLPDYFVSTVDSGNFLCCLVALMEGVKEYAVEEPELLPLIGRIKSLIDGADLGFFYSERRNLFTIGYDSVGKVLSTSHYDFLMSEARMLSFFALAKRQVSRKHWGAMNRTMSRLGSYAGPVSWTGTMFEYFMPHMLLPAYEGSLLSEGLRYSLYCQMQRTKGYKLPWGVSESGYFAFDSGLSYQYKAHGAQKLGVKQGLDKELVVSPYSSFLTVAFAPGASMENLRELEKMGVYGRHGFFEAVDFTPWRLEGERMEVVRSYMAHHIGMSMIASINALYENRMQRRFMRDPDMAAADEFLQERINKDTVVYDSVKQTTMEERVPDGAIDEEYAQIFPQQPQAALLYNGELGHLLTDTGAGQLRWDGVDLTRQSRDLLRNPQGIFCLIKDRGATVSVTKAPYYDPAVEYAVAFQGRSVTYKAHWNSLNAQLRFLLSPTRCCEQVQLTLENHGSLVSDASILFYLEPVLASYGEYSAHPAFSKLFLTTSYDAQSHTLTFTRRGRGGEEPRYLTVGLLEELGYEYSLKRENLMPAPGGLMGLREFDTLPFSGGEGTPDACCAIRLRLPVQAGGGKSKVTLLIAASMEPQGGITEIVAARRQGVLPREAGALSPLMRDTIVSRLAFSLLGQLAFPKLDARERDARGMLTALGENTLGQSGLWSLGISGDLPIVLLEFDGGVESQRLEAYLEMQILLRRCAFPLDLVVFYQSLETPGFQTAAEVCLTHTGAWGTVGVRGGVHLIDLLKIEPQVAGLVRAAARHISTKLIGAVGSVKREYLPMALLPVEPDDGAKPVGEELTVHGGSFIGESFWVDKTSPLPYSHILANPVFGTLLSDRALGYTWAVNARENKLTPWKNDIATDNDGELLLLRTKRGCYNLINGSRAEFTPGFARYHGVLEGCIATTVTVTVPKTGTVKLIDLTLENRGEEEREVEIAYYIEPVLGVGRDTSRFITARYEAPALLLQNPYNTAVPSALAMCSDGAGQRVVCERSDFFCGRWGEESLPPNVDPCGSLIVPKALPPHRKEQIRFILSYGATEEGAKAQTECTPGASSPKERPSQYRIETPDKALNALINTFVPHQIAAGRIMGRTAFYQCGGAYGFRDQLQDVTAYLLIDPGVARIQILRCCAVQFLEGDVLHWWHRLPKTAAGSGLTGVRTNYSDDLLWLPYGVSEYLRRTGDVGLLHVKVPYLEAEPLGAGEQERYLSPKVSSRLGTVYEHCLLAIERASRMGDRDLPLMGCGDWNDGYNRVGEGGKGQSVWLALFLSWVARLFAPVAEEFGEPEKSEELLALSERLQKAVDATAWDGAWYLRAFYDDGSPMGGKGQDECRIDLLPQSFAVLAGMPDRERVDSALSSALEQLVDRKNRIVSLFTPAFALSTQNPGYVKAYPRGIRENGGQYTHGAVWLAIALLERGWNGAGYELLTYLSPTHRAMDESLAKAYKTEPYYLAADIYTSSAALGHGGWSLYTGAASWYYRAVLENLLGLRIEGKVLRITPRLPGIWRGKPFSLECVIDGTPLSITMEAGDRSELLCDGVPVSTVPLDEVTHRVEVFAFSPPVEEEDSGRAGKTVI